jgi:hypothetical protein
MAKVSLTLDDIFGKNNDENEETIVNETQDNIETKSTIKNTTKKYKTKNSINGNKSDSKTNNSKNDTLTNNIDNILNNGLVKFENKIQTSMFFVCYKSMNSLLLELQNIHNIIIPKEFIDKQSISIIPNIIKEYTGNLKKRCKKIINLDMICIGRKLDNKQCTRKKHNDSEFCKSHFIKLSNGRIDEPTQVNLRNKRGRKRKVEFDPRQYDNEYITLWEDIINGEKVLVDSNNNIYTFDLQTPQYIGKKDIFNKLDITSILNKISKQKEEESKKEDTILEIPLPESNILEIPLPESKIENKIESDIPITINNTKKNKLNIKKTKLILQNE